MNANEMRPSEFLARYARDLWALACADCDGDDLPDTPSVWIEKARANLSHLRCMCMTRGAEAACLTLLDIGLKIHVADNPIPDDASGAAQALVRDGFVRVNNVWVKVTPRAQYSPKGI